MSASLRATVLAKVQNGEVISHEEIEGLGGFEAFTELVAGGAQPERTPPHKRAYAPGTLEYRIAKKRADNRAYKETKHPGRSWRFDLGAFKVFVISFVVAFGLIGKGCSWW